MINFSLINTPSSLSGFISYSQVIFVFVWGGVISFTFLLTIFSFLVMRQISLLHSFLHTERGVWLKRISLLYFFIVLGFFLFLMANLIITIR